MDSDIRNATDAIASKCTCMTYKEIEDPINRHCIGNDKVLEWADRMDVFPCAKELFGIRRLLIAMREACVEKENNDG